MKIKKLFAFILAAAMALLLFACGKPAAPASSSAPSSADDAQPHYTGPGPSDAVIYNKLNAVIPNADAKALELEEVEALGLTADMKEEDIVAKFGEAKEVRDEDDGEGMFGKRIYVYDGMTITFLKTLYGEPYQDEIYSAEFTANDTPNIRGIKLGDSLYDVVAKFPQELDYRTGTLYGNPLDKYCEGFGVLQGNDNSYRGSSYLLIICKRFFPSVNFHFDEDLKLITIVVKYRNNGFEE